jgi:Secretion system C-terminal sorting domain/Fibronectin type III domain
MKKKVLFLVVIVTFTSIYSQTINVTYTWPSSDWLLNTGFTAGNLLSNPTTSGSNFKYDDSQVSNAGDIIHLASPVIDLRGTATNENGLLIAFKIAYEVSVTEVLKIQYWDADADSGAGKWKQFPDGSQADAGVLGDYSTCTYDANNSDIKQYLDFSNFTDNQKQNFRIRFVYEDGGLTSGGGFCFSAPTVTSLSCSAPTDLNLVSIGTNGAQIGWTSQNSETQWQIDFGSENFNHTGGIVNDTNQNPVGLGGLSEATSYDIYVRADCSDGGSYFSPWSSKFNFVTMLQNPNTLTVNNITKASVDISWGYPGAQNKWNVEYGPQGYTRGSNAKIASFVSTDNTTNPISGLTAGTTYDFYVQAIDDNGSFSDWVGSSFTTLQSYETAISLDISNWDNLNCGSLQQNGTGLRVYGTEYRVGAYLETQTFYNLQNAEALFKWKINNNGSGLATTANINLIGGYQLTMSGVSPNHWYYTHVYINSDKTYTIKVADNNYDDDGGTVLYTYTGTISDTKWNLLGSDNIMIEFNDNYGGMNSYLDLDEVRLRHAAALDNTVNDSNKTTYDFEDGTLPSDYVFADNTWSNDSSSGYNGTHGLQVIVPINQSSSASLTLVNTKRISFDVKYNGDTHKGARLMIDGNTVAEFDRSTSWCWKHVEWQLPDDAQHEISWYIAGTQYDEHSSLLVIDNVVIYKTDTALGLDKLNVNEFNYYPNPTFGFITLNARENIEQIELYNLVGQKVMIKQPNVSTYQLNISNLKTGVYFMKVKVADKTGKQYFINCVSLKK